MARSNPRSSRGRRWLAGFSALVLVAMTALIPAASVSAAEPTNMVLVWNENAISVLSAPRCRRDDAAHAAGPGPTLRRSRHCTWRWSTARSTTRSTPSIGGHEPYLDGLSAPSTASKAAAVAQAAHDVLVGLTPTTPPAGHRPGSTTCSRQSLGADRPRVRPRPPASPSAPRRLPRCCSSAEHRRPLRRRAVPAPATSSASGGRCRRCPSNVFGQFATVTPLTMKSPGQCRTGRPARTSRAPSTPRNSTRSRRSVRSRDRAGPPAQTLLAGFATANPLVLHERGLREIAGAKGLSTTEQALLFVKTSMGSADALIGCWANKKVLADLAAADGDPRGAQRRQPG